MSQTTIRIEKILAESTQTMWNNSRGDGVIVGIPVRKRNGMTIGLYNIYQRIGGEFIFLGIGEK